MALRRFLRPLSVLAGASFAATKSPIYSESPLTTQQRHTLLPEYIDPINRMAIPESEIIYQDADVCILKPDSEHGVPVFHSSASHSICTDKLYSHQGLREAHPELGLQNRSRIQKDPEHDKYIFFRAPYYYSKYNTFDGYFGETPEIMVNKNIHRPNALAVIRVDPEKTYVYFSEARIYGKNISNVVKTRIKLSEYLSRLQSFIKGHNYSLLAPHHIKNGFKEYRSKEYRFEENNFEDNTYKWFHANRYWEIIVKLPFLKREHYKCYINTVSSAAEPAGGGGGGGGGTYSASREPTTLPADKFQPIYLPEYKVQCPECKVIKDSAHTFTHLSGCPNEGKNPLLDFAKMAQVKGGRRRRRQTKRRLNRRRHTRK